MLRKVRASLLGSLSGLKVFLGTVGSSSRRWQCRKCAASEESPRNGIPTHRPHPRPCAATFILKTAVELATTRPKRHQSRAKCTMPPGSLATCRVTQSAAASRKTTLHYEFSIKLH